MNKKTIKEMLFIILSVTIITYFIYVIITPSSVGEEGLASLKPSLETENKPILVVSVEDSYFDTEDQNCKIIVNGSVTNIGEQTAEEVMIRCRPSVYPIVETNIQASKQIGTINYTEKIDFQVERTIECDQKIRFDCTAECKNC